jgi:hypothetical protein
MKCPNCRSTRIRASIHRGLREGFFLRLLLLAPYRCKNCSSRFFRFAGFHAFRSHGEHKTLTGYLGLRDAYLRRFQRTICTIVIFLILLFVAAYMVHYLTAQGSPL